MAVIRKIKLPSEAAARDIGALSSNVIYDGDSEVTTPLNDKIQSIFTAIGDINSFEIAIVSELPATGDDHTIYFVPESEGSTSHNEYMYIDNQWELIGTTTIDLSDYALKSELPTKTSDLTNDSGFIKQFLVTVTQNEGIYSSDKTLAEITAADTNGYEVICHCVDDGSYLKLLSLSAGFAMFQLFGSNINGPASETIRINSNGNVEHQFDFFPGEVSATSTLSEGTEIGSITVDGTTTTLYAPEAPNITVTQALTTGVPTATITVGATTTTIYSVEDVDEKLKTEILPKTGIIKQVILGNAITTPQTKYYSSNLGFSDTENNKSILIVGQESGRSGQLRLKSGSGSSSTDLVAGSLIGGNNTITLPNTSGTLALTTDIPSVTVTQGITTGITIGSIDINGITTTFYAPEATSPIQSDWKQTTDTELDYIKNKPAVWDSEDYTVPSGQTYGNSDTKAIGAVALNLITNNAKGNYSVSEGYQGSGNTNVVIKGVSTTLPFGASGDYSHAEGYYTAASGDYSHTEGSRTTASGGYSHAEGYNTIASGNYSHVEGYIAAASGGYSHAEGYNTIASGMASHAEGDYVLAYGDQSHAEGNLTVASAPYSHAEGYYSVASGWNSHAEGSGIVITAILNAADANSTSYTLSTPVEVSNSNLLAARQMFVYSKNKTGTTSSWTAMKPERITACTISGNSLTGFTVANTLFTDTITTGAVKIMLPKAKNDCAHVQGQGTVSNAMAQHVSGKWNIQTDGAEVIGNGTDDLNRSNIRTLDWSGNEWIAGKLTVGATPTANMDVATKQYVDTAVSGASGKTYTLSMTGPTINLLADGVAASTITLPIYDGTVALADAAVVG